MDETTYQKHAQHKTDTNVQRERASERKREREGEGEREEAGGREAGREGDCRGVSEGAGDRQVVKLVFLALVRHILNVRIARCCRALCRPCRPSDLPIPDWIEVCHPFLAGF